MKIVVGTNNIGKIEAVKRGVEEYPMLLGSTIDSCAVDSKVPDQPIGLEEIVLGARNRAYGAYISGNYNLAFGVESGIFSVPYTKSGYMNTTCCVIYDGKQYHIGLSSCFEYPKDMTDKIFKEGKEVSDIALEMGFSNNIHFSQSLGMIGLLTKGRTPLVDYFYQGVQAALIHLENSNHY